MSTKNSTIATSDRKATLNNASESQRPSKVIKEINNDDLEEKQRQMRIKYGSSKMK
jgi:hypothetical protein